MLSICCRSTKHWKEYAVQNTFRKVQLGTYCSDRKERRRGEYNCELTVYDVMTFFISVLSIKILVKVSENIINLCECFSFFYWHRIYFCLWNLFENKFRDVTPWQVKVTSMKSVLAVHQLFLKNISFKSEVFIWPS